MEIRGIKIKKKDYEPTGSGLFMLRPPEYFSVPLLADDGDKPVRIVNVGDSVKEGSLIARPSGRYGSFVYSPCSGKVVSVVNKLNVSGNMCEHIVLSRDLKDEKVYFKSIDADNFDQEHLLKRLYESGMVDSFEPYDPAYKKYLLKCKVKKLVINCTEDDPYITCDSALIETYTKEIIDGARLLKIVAKAERLVFIFSQRQKKIAKILYNEIKKAKLTKHIRVKLYPDVYPLHNSRLVGYYETGRMVVEGNRTAETSVIVDNPANCLDFYNAVTKGIPATQKAVSIGGKNCLREANYFIKNGTSISHILEVVGTKKITNDNVLIYGGIMSGLAQETDDVSVTLTASCVLFCNSDDYVKDVESPCINCGQCVEHCPVRLHVNEIDDAVVQREYTYAKRLGVDACIGCGVCSYVCPAKRYLAQRMIFMKDLATGKSAKRPDSSEYGQVDTQGDFNKKPKEFDKILQIKENFQIPGDNSNNTPAINDMLASLGVKNDDKGGNSNG